MLKANSVNNGPTRFGRTATRCVSNRGQQDHVLNLAAVLENLMSNRRENATAREGASKAVGVIRAFGGVPKKDRSIDGAENCPCSLAICGPCADDSGFANTVMARRCTWPVIRNQARKQLQTRGRVGTGGGTVATALRLLNEPRSTVRQ